MGETHFHPLPYDTVEYASSDRSTPTVPDIYTPAPSQTDLFASGSFSNDQVNQSPAQPNFFAPEHFENGQADRVLVQPVPYGMDTFRSSDLDRLPVQFITPSLERQYSLSLIKLVNSKRWGVTISGLVHHWLLREPKTAILFWMCDEVDALPKAANVYQLKDKNLPYKEEDLINIVTDPSRVVKTQWKAVMKQLPRGGHHVEFQTRDEIPLAMHGDIGPYTSSTTKTLHKVRFLDGSDTAMYVRKRLVINYDRAQDKNAILAQIRTFHKLEHKNIAPIVSSYIRGCTVAFVTPLFDTNLEEYMDAISGFSQSELLLGWIHDLTSALTYIHANDIEHKNIRPQKILIDSQDRIHFSVFGVCPPVRSSYAQLYEAYSNNPSYIYAAPEVASGDIGLGNMSLDPSVDAHTSAKTRARQTDVYSLGCILFELVAKAKGRTMKEVRDYRSFETHDNSFHKNLNRVYMMVDQLKTVPLSTSASRRQRIEDGSKRGLEVIKRMLHAEPSNRPAIHKVLSHLRKPLKPRRTSFDVTLASEFKGSQQRGLESLLPNQSAVWSELQSLQPHYDRPQGYGQSHYDYPGQAYYAE
jgi:serine/threonine protein kinase